MPFMMSDYYKPQIQAGEIQAQKDLHQIRLAEIARGQREEQQLATIQEGARKIFGDTGVPSPPSGDVGETGEPAKAENFLPQIAKQADLANKQEKYAQLLVANSQPQLADKMWDNARNTRKSAEDLVNKQLLEQKRRADQLSSILGPVTEAKTQEAYNTALTQLEKVNPAFAAQLPKVYNASTAQLVNQLANQGLDRKAQIDLALKDQKDKELQDYRAARLEEQRLSRLDRNSNAALTRELAMQRLEEHKREFAARGAGKGAAAKGVGTPRASDIKAATRMVEDDFPGISSKDADKAGRDIASLAKEYMTKNPDLNLADATDQAYEEVKQSLTPPVERKLLEPSTWFGAAKPEYKKGAAPKAAAPKVGAPSTARPAGMSDADWKEYQAYVKSQGGK